MNILITGAGLIGCHAARQLLEKGHQVVLYELFPNQEYIKSVIGETKSLAVEAGDLRDLPTLLTVLQKYRSDTVVHTAGLTGRKVAEHPYTGVTVNVQGSVNVAEAVRILSLKRLIFMSSSDVYNRSIPAAAPITEDFPLGCRGLYLASKMANEHLLGAIAELAGFEFIIRRPAAAFGRGVYQGGSTVNLMISELLGRLMRRETVCIKEALIGTNEYIYVKDIAQVIEKACTVASIKSRAFNVGAMLLLSAAEFVRRVCKVIPGAKVELVPLGPGEILDCRLNLDLPLDFSRAITELEYDPKYSLEAALTDYIVK